MLCFIVNAMESPILTSQQFTIILPVGLVIIFAVLVFAFGFKSSVEPPSFKQLSYTPDDRKNSKKKRVKDKKPQTNGHATVVIDVPEAKKTEAVKPVKQTSKVETPKQKKIADAEKVQEKKPEVQKSPVKKDKKKENVEGKSKKNAQNSANEKPADFDEGEWETAPSRKDKKSKKKDDQDILPTYTPEKASKKKPTTVTKQNAVDKVTALEPVTMEILRIEDILPQPKVEILEAVVPTIKAVAPAPVVEAVTPAPAAPAVVAAAPEPAAEEQVAKKKKVKKAKTSASEEDAVVPVVVPAAAAPAPVPVVAAPRPSEPVAVEPVAESAQVFNELEDAWKEAPQKKSKKKVRKD